MRYIFSLLIFLAILTAMPLAYFSLTAAPECVPETAPPVNKLWQVRSIDTMKYSRDIAREKLNDKDFDTVIEFQTRNIAETGATHVAIATPYDEEFVPLLSRWVEAARRHGLNVWFRGNWSGWERWFDYPQIDRQEHIKKTREFITKHPNIFEDGDIFTSCPECENGGPGDPRRTGDVTGHRAFLIEEYAATKKALEETKKDVRANYFSMNGDVARLVMDKSTTAALGGVVTIDHYVETPEQLARDIRSIAAQSGGRVVLGEFGAPLADIHGKLSEEEQGQWVHKALFELAHVKEVEGINYWVSVGGATELWTKQGRTKPAADVIAEFYEPVAVYGVIKDELGRPVKEASVKENSFLATTDKRGFFSFPRALTKDKILSVSALGYVSSTVDIGSHNPEDPLVIVVSPEHESVLYKIGKKIKEIFKSGK